MPLVITGWRTNKGEEDVGQDLQHQALAAAWA